MPKKADNKTIVPIKAKFNDVAKKIVQPNTNKSLKNNELTKKITDKPNTNYQYALDLGIEVEKTINGIEMGVLENGIPFLTQNGLANVCGVAKSIIYDIAKDWVKNFDNNILGKDRNSFLKEYLFRHGYNDPLLYIETESSGVSHYSYPDIVCMAILEYYAFESKSNNKKATENYRKFAQYGFQQFIYQSVGYEEQDKWKLHNERQSVLRSTVPFGYFSIFHEINPLTIDLIHANLPVNDKTVPDISVGQRWAEHWKEISNRYPQATSYKGDYPLSYRQSKANGFIKPKAYPDEALPEFRRWFREEYLTTKFPKYILNKANILKGGKEEAQKLIAAFTPKQLQSD